MRLIDADALDRRIYNDVPISTFGSIRRMAAVRKLIEEAPTVEPASQWHRVEEPPKKEKRYLVWDVDGFAYCDTWKEGEWQVASSVPGTNISHWMSVDPPKEDA